MMSREQAIEALRAAVTLPTVAGQGRQDALFEELGGRLRLAFPQAFSACEQVEIGGHALLLRWPGREAADPLVLMAHQDVVPVVPEDTWTHPPFEGRVVDGVMWGRAMRAR